MARRLLRAQVVCAPLVLCLLFAAALPSAAGDDSTPTDHCTPYSDSCMECTFQPGCGWCERDDSAGLASFCLDGYEDSGSSIVHCNATGGEFTWEGFVCSDRPSCHFSWVTFNPYICIDVDSQQALLFVLPMLGLAAIMFVGTTMLQWYMPRPPPLPAAGERAPLGIHICQECSVRWIPPKTKPQRLEAFPPDTGAGVQGPGGDLSGPERTFHTTTCKRCSRRNWAGIPFSLSLVAAVEAYLCLLADFGTALVIISYIAATLSAVFLLLGLLLSFFYRRTPIASAPPPSAPDAGTTPTPSTTTTGNSNGDIPGADELGISMARDVRRFLPHVLEAGESVVWYEQASLLYTLRETMIGPMVILFVGFVLFMAVICLIILVFTRSSFVESTMVMDFLCILLWPWCGTILSLVGPNLASVRSRYLVTTHRLLRIYRSPFGIPYVLSVPLAWAGTLRLLQMGASEEEEYTQGGKGDKAGEATDSPHAGESTADSTPGKYVEGGNYTSAPYSGKGESGGEDGVWNETLESSGALLQASGPASPPSLAQQRKRERSENADLHIFPYVRDATLLGTALIERVRAGYQPAPQPMEDREESQRTTLRYITRFKRIGMVVLPGIINMSIWVGFVLSGNYSLVFLLMVAAISLLMSTFLAVAVASTATLLRVAMLEVHAKATDFDVSASALAASAL